MIPTKCCEKCKVQCRCPDPNHSPKKCANNDCPCHTALDINNPEHRAQAMKEAVKEANDEQRAVVDKATITAALENPNLIRKAAEQGAEDQNKMLAALEKSDQQIGKAARALGGDTTPDWESRFDEEFGEIEIATDDLQAIYGFKFYDDIKDRIRTLVAEAEERGRNEGARWIAILRELLLRSGPSEKETVLLEMAQAEKRLRWDRNPRN